MSSTLRIFASIVTIIVAIALVWFGAFRHAPAGSAAHRLLVAFNSDNFGRDASDNGAGSSAQ